MDQPQPQPQPELRTDWLTGRTVLIAENRALRPNDFGGEVAAATGIEATSYSPTCPFCLGNESRTPPPVYEKLDAHGNWQIRVVANMYPAVVTDGLSVKIVATDGPSVTNAGQPLASTSPAIGAHEVIIENARHADRLSDLAQSELRLVLESYTERLRYWREDGRFHYGLVFKNQGHDAGASMAHLHSQLIALPFVPPVVEAENGRASAAYSRDGLCPYCKLLSEERTNGSRIVADYDGFVAFCPFASWQPYEVWLMPADHGPWFELMTSDGLDRLTHVLHPLIEGLETTVPDAAYNMIIRTAPWVSNGQEWSHWRIELLPRTNAFAGLEVATEIHINPLSPERAARQLRN